MRSLIERLSAATSEPPSTFEKLKAVGMDSVGSLVTWAKSYQECNKAIANQTVAYTVTRLLFNLKFAVARPLEADQLRFWSMCYVIGHLLVDEAEFSKPDRFKAEFKPLERLHRSKSGKWIVSHPAYPNRLYTGRTREEALGHMMFEMLDPANAGRFA